MPHTFDPANAGKLEDVGRYRFCSRDELVAMLDPAATDVVADLGSGTGFYTGDVAPFVETLYAVDVQPAMHEQFEAKGVPANVDLVTSEAADLPFEDDALDGAFSTMTFHEFAGTGAIAELARVIGDGGRLVTVDWSARGAGEAGPPAGERHDLERATEFVESEGFTVDRGAERPETFALIATRSA